MTKSAATSYEIAKDLFLIREDLSQGTTAPAEPQPTNHVMVIDCSGSMTSDLPRIRDQLKKRAPKLLKEGDTLSMIWFSGRGDFGVLLEGEPVATLKDLQQVNQVIDRWLRPVGLTGFKEPLQEVAALAMRLHKKNKNPLSLFFMSDGCDNQWAKADIFKAIDAVDAVVTSATFVEYGYYADRALLATMAEKCGGSLIFAESFDTFEPILEQKLAQRSVDGKWVTVKIDGDAIGGFAFALDHEHHEITTYAVMGGAIDVPDTVKEVFYLSPTKIGAGDLLSRYVRQMAYGQEPSTVQANAAYAAMSLFAIRMKPDVVYPILKVLGDVAFIDAFAGCFGKQKYTEFMQSARTAAFYPDVRLLFGYDPKKVPRDDAFTVLDLLRILTEDDNTRLLLDHETFKYSKISRSRVDADENFYVAEQEKLDELKAKLALAKKPAEVKAIQGEIDALMANKRTALKFLAKPAPNGYELSNLTYNEKRANISMLVRKEGTIDLSSRIATAPASLIKFHVDGFDTHIWRNFSIVVDGLVNIETLPVTVSKETTASLTAMGVKFRKLGDSTLPTDTLLIDVKALPVINRNMVGACSAQTLIEQQYELCEAKAYQKVYNAASKAQGTKGVSTDLLAEYGPEAVAWLKEQGITDNGFSPKSAVAESTDFYIGKQLEVKLKGFSSLPKVEDAKAGKGGQNGVWMKAASDEIEKHKKASDDTKHALFVADRQREIVKQTRGLIQKMARQKFAIIVGQIWPREFSSVDENKLNVKIDGKEISGIIEMSEIEVHI